MKFKLSIGVVAAILACAPAMAAPTFTKQSGVLLSNAEPYSIDLSTAPYRLYYTQNGQQIVSATSVNGSSWSAESGVRVDTNTTPSVVTTASFSFTGASVLRRNDGSYRILYSIAASSFSSWNILTAISADGLTWTNENTIPFASAQGFLGRPQLVKQSSTDWRVYFLRDSNGGDDLTDRVVYTASSNDQGANWGAPTVALSAYASEIAVSTRTDGRVRLFLIRPLSQETTSSVVLSALSPTAAGTSLDMESGTRLSTSSAHGRLSSTVVFRSSDTVRWRMLYGYELFSTNVPDMFTAVTLDPDPQSISPSQVLRSGPAAAFTIAGEIFDTSVAVRLTRGGESDIVGTSVVRNNDLSVTATFDTNNKTLGFWDLTVTNADARAATLSNALLITFESGNLVLTDNLLRPRTGAQTRMDISVFDAGEVTVDIYTLDGDLVRSLYNAHTALGPLVLYWDGKTGDGNTVASGVYFVHATGPKLDDKKKIVVIR